MQASLKSDYHVPSTLLGAWKISVSTQAENLSPVALESYWAGKGVQQDKLKNKIIERLGGRTCCGKGEQGKGGDPKGRIDRNRAGDREGWGGIAMHGEGQIPETSQKEEREKL